MTASSDEDFAPYAARAPELLAPYDCARIAFSTVDREAAWAELDRRLQACGFEVNCLFALPLGQKGFPTRDLTFGIAVSKEFMEYAWAHPELAQTVAGVRDLVTSDAIVPLLPSHPSFETLTAQERTNFEIMSRFGFKGGFAASFPERFHGRVTIFSTSAHSSEALAAWLFETLGETAVTAVAMFLEGLAIRELVEDENYLPLSFRERECLALATTGSTTKRIAVRLGLTDRTVNEYIANACRKLGSENRTQAAARAMLMTWMD